MIYDFTNAMGLDEGECQWLKERCRGFMFETAIEFGPGNSTVAMLEGGVRRIWTFEENARRLMQFEPDPRVVFHTYAATDWNLSIPQINADIAFIDGPKGSAVYPSRLNACLAVFPLVKWIFLHDSKRDALTENILVQLGARVIMRHPSDRGITMLITPLISVRP